MTLALVTPSYAPDFPQFRALHDSVLAHTSDDVMHYVLVPTSDITRFSTIRSTRLTVLGQTDVLPGSFLPTTPLARIPRIPRGYRIAAVNLRHPWPPVRGWILQQLVKLAFVASLDVDVAVILDSEVLLVRELSESMFRRGPAVRHYRVPHGLNATMTRHLRWRSSAARLLGVDAPSADYADYVAGLMSWSPATVRAVLARVEATTGGSWATVLAAQREFSEYILYGEYVSALGTEAESSFVSDHNLCHTYWGPEPLTLDDAPQFLSTMPHSDLALLVQSNTHTPAVVLDYLVEAIARQG